MLCIARGAYIEIAFFAVMENFSLLEAEMALAFALEGSQTKRVLEIAGAQRDGTALEAETNTFDVAVHAPQLDDLPLLTLRAVIVIVFRS